MMRIRFEGEIHTTFPRPEMLVAETLSSLQVRTGVRIDPHAHLLQHENGEAISWGMRWGEVVNDIIHRGHSPSDTVLELVWGTHHLIEIFVESSSTDMKQRQLSTPRIHAVELPLHASIWNAMGALNMDPLYHRIFTTKVQNGVEHDDYIDVCTTADMIVRDETMDEIRISYYSPDRTEVACIQIDDDQRSEIHEIYVDITQQMAIIGVVLNVSLKEEIELIFRGTTKKSPNRLQMIPIELDMVVGEFLRKHGDTIAVIRKGPADTDACRQRAKRRELFGEAP